MNVFKIIFRGLLHPRIVYQVLLVVFLLHFSVLRIYPYLHLIVELEIANDSGFVCSGVTAQRSETGACDVTASESLHWSAAAAAAAILEQSVQSTVR